MPTLTFDGVNVGDFVPARYSLGPNPLDRSSRDISGQSFLNGVLRLVPPRGRIEGEGDIEITGDIIVTGEVNVTGDIFVSDDLSVADTVTVLGVTTLADLVLAGVAVTGGWVTAHTPVVTQSVTVTKTTTMSRYAKIGRLVIWAFYLTVTGSGTASQVVTVTLPFTAAATAGSLCGVGYIYDSSVNLNYTGLTALFDSTHCSFVIGGTNSNYLGGTGSGFTAGLASSDGLLGLVIYEATS